MFLTARLDFPFRALAFVAHCPVRMSLRARPNAAKATKLAAPKGFAAILPAGLLRISEKLARSLCTGPSGVSGNASAGPVAVCCSSFAPSSVAHLCGDSFCASESIEETWVIEEGSAERGMRNFLKRNKEHASSKTSKRDSPETCGQKDVDKIDGEADESLKAFLQKKQILTALKLQRRQPRQYKKRGLMYP